jgi:hypothetical protein
MSFVAGAEQPAQLPVHVDAGGGMRPDIYRYYLAGAFENGRVPFTADLLWSSGAWKLSFARSGTPRIHLELDSDRYDSLILNRVTISALSTRRSRESFVIRLPYGEPKTECFANGDEVFQHLLIHVGSHSVSSVSDYQFKECQGEYVPVRIRATSAGLSVGG